MNKIKHLTNFSDRKKIYIGGAVLLIIGIIVILLMFSIGGHVELKDTSYENGQLVSTFSFSGEKSHKVWVQYKILRVNGMFSTTDALDLTSTIETFKEGDNVAKLPVNLYPGEYKAFIYVYDYDDVTKRMAGFIRYFEVLE